MNILIVDGNDLESSNNLRKFGMKTQYEEYGDMILERSGMSKREMDLIHANLWLSLTGYVKEDVEAALFSFFMGTYIWSTRAIT